MFLVKLKSVVSYSRPCSKILRTGGYDPEKALKSPLTVPEKMICETMGTLYDHTDHADWFPIVNNDVQCVFNVFVMY